MNFESCAFLVNSTESLYEYLNPFMLNNVAEEAKNNSLPMSRRPSMDWLDTDANRRNKYLRFRHTELDEFVFNKLGRADDKVRQKHEGLHVVGSVDSSLLEHVPR